MALTPTMYVVNKDWDSQQVGDIVSYVGAGQNFTFGTDGFASIYETILDANGIAVPGAVGADPLTPSPVPYTQARQYVYVVNGRFNETALAGADAKYTLDFSSIYTQESLLTSFVGSFTSEAVNDVGIRVSKGTVLFGAPETNTVVDDVITAYGTNITLKRSYNGTTHVGQWEDSDFVVGGDLPSYYGENDTLLTAEAKVTDTSIFADGGWIWVGSAFDNDDEAFEDFLKEKTPRFTLTATNSSLKSTTLQVRNNGKLDVTGSKVDTTAMVLRGNATFTKSDVTVGATGNFNVYGENSGSATLTLNNGSTLTAGQILKIGRADSETGGYMDAGNVGRKGALVLNASSIGTEAAPSGAIAVNENGTLTMDAASKIYAGAITNDGEINITIDANGEDWINATSFNNTNEVGTIKIGGTFEGGVKRVIYAAAGVVKVADIVVTAKDAKEETATAATRGGKVAIATGVDYTTLYLSNRINEDADFAKSIKDRAQDKTYFVDFNAFQDPASALEEGVKPTVTKTILIDGGDPTALIYNSNTTASIDGLTFAKDGTNAAAEDDTTTEEIDETKEQNVVFTLSGMDPETPESYRALVSGVTVGAGVTFTADKLYQYKADEKSAPVTTINGELKMAANDTFQIAGGEVNINGTFGIGLAPVEPVDPTQEEQDAYEEALALYNARVGKYQSILDDVVPVGMSLDEYVTTHQGSLTGTGIVSIIATKRDAQGNKIPAELNVTGAPITLAQLEIGANSTVTLKGSTAEFGTVIMRKTNVEDFDGPVLTIINSEVTANSFDTTKGTVNIDFQSQLFVVPVGENQPMIEGGNLNLTVSTDDVKLLQNYEGAVDPTKPQPKAFYTIVHAALNMEEGGVNLTCDHDENDDGYIDGTKYIYTDLGGQGLFVMHEDVAKNIYVNAAWTNKQTGEVVGDGMFYGINAFETFTGALSAATKRTDATSITLLSDVTEDDLESMSYKLQNAVTVKGNFTVVWNVTTQTQDDGSVYFFGDKDKTSEKLTFEAGTTYQAQGVGPIYIGYDPTNDKGPENRMDAEFNGTIQTSSVYVGRWSNLTVTGKITSGGWIYLRKHSKILIDGTNWTSEDHQVSTTAAALIYGGTTTVLNSDVSIGGQLKVSNRNVINEETYNMPAETTVFAATNSTIYANSFDSNKVGSETNGDVKDSVTSLVKSTMNIATGVNNFGTFYVGVAVKAKDIIEEEVIVKNTVEVDDTITDAASTLIVGGTISNNEGKIVVANESTVDVSGDVNNSGEFSFAGSTFLAGSTVGNTGVITFTGETKTEQVEVANSDPVEYEDKEVVVPSTATITGTLFNKAGGVITITDSTVSANAVDNKGSTAAVATITVGTNGVLSGTSVTNNSKGVLNVTGGSVIANSDRIYNYGTMNLNGAKFKTTGQKIQNTQGSTINIDGDVTFFDGEELVRGSITNYTKSGDVHKDAIINMGVSNINDINSSDIKNPAFVNVDINGGTVAFSAAGLTFDIAATSLTGDEAVASAKLSGGTIYVNKAGITLTDSGFKVIEQEAVPGEQDEVSHKVYNNTGSNSIKIAANSDLTLDKNVAGWNNVSGAANNSLVVKDLTIAAGGSLKMDWSQCLTVNGTVAAAGSSAITVTLDPLEVYTALNTDKLVIADANATDAAYRTFVKDYEAFFTVHVNGVEEWTGVTGLYLDASKFVKVSQDHGADLGNGWYEQFNTVSGGQDPEDQGAVDSEAGVVLGIDGEFTNVFLKDKVTMIVGSEDEEATLTFSGIFAGGFDVSAMSLESEEYETAGPAKLNMKIHEGSTNVAISAGTFSNAVVVGGDLVKIAGEETKVNYYRVGDINTVIDGGDFVTTAGNQRMIVGGEYYQAATIDDKRVSIGAANLTGDVKLTISGGSFKGYDVYGGNYANQKSFGKYASIDGNVTITLDSSDQALAFTKSDKSPTTGKTYGGSIYGGSFGAGAITGDVKVVLTGDKNITFEKLYGGCTGDFRQTAGTLESNVEGARILSFEGFTGALNSKAVIDAFNTVTFTGVNELNFNVTGSYFNKDVTNWVFAADAEGNAAVTGSFEFDFTGDKVDLSGCADGFTLSHVTSIDGADFGALADCVNYNAETKVLTLQLA